MSVTSQFAMSLGFRAVRMVSVDDLHPLLTSRTVFTSSSDKCRSTRIWYASSGSFWSMIAAYPVWLISYTRVSFRLQHFVGEQDIYRCTAPWASPGAADCRA